MKNIRENALLGTGFIVVLLNSMLKYIYAAFREKPKVVESNEREFIQIAQVDVILRFVAKVLDKTVKILNVRSEERFFTLHKWTSFYIFMKNIGLVGCKDKANCPQVEPGPVRECPLWCLPKGS